ncbi:hypothetical protein ALC62_07945 [Cyphomyrmex costatus]|uniref:THAP-type domain-containing protein n=1 Tax=Cyphomyrmex costatus TaxID=456900 RepID=A0A195CKT0_9HYME|nr:hypothetical protein ALC62_07945 [Cyphomyrmex costatus]
MPHCVVNCCNNSYSKGFVMLRFPTDPIIREKWRIAVGREENWRATINHRLCEKHFKRDDWIVYRKRIKKDAVPTLFFCNDNLDVTISETSIDQSLTNPNHIELRNQNYIEHNYFRSNVKLCQHTHLDCSSRQELFSNSNVKQENITESQVIIKTEIDIELEDFSSS